jgi:hypothetical protein
MINLVMEFMDCGSIQTIVAVEKAFKTPQDRQRGPLIPEGIISKFVSHVRKNSILIRILGADGLGIPPRREAPDS